MSLEAAELTRAECSNLERSTSDEKLNDGDSKAQDTSDRVLGCGIAKKYSNLEHMSATPMAAAVLKSLRKKSADVRFMCNEVCGAAVEEGSRYFQTRALSSIRQEGKFHRRLQLNSLPYQSRSRRN